MRLLITAISIVLLSGSSSAATIHVPSDQPTIQAGINAASNGDTVLVAPGNYAEHITFGSVSVVLMSSGGDSVTFISGYISDQNLVSFPLGQHNSSTIRGFTIRNALGRPAVMIENSNSPQIIDCSMTNNSNGLYCYGDTVIIRGCTFAHNSGGMLIYVESAELTVIDQCSFYDNSWYGSFYGGGISHINYGVISFTKNLVYGNTASQGSIIQLRSDSFVNNTVYGNSTGSESAIVQVEGTEQRNNIIAFNRGGYGISSATPPEYNNVYGNTGGNYYGTVPGTGSISQDPLFTDTAQADFTLQSGSPCINAGDPDPQYNDPDGSRNDMGALPYASPLPSPIRFGVMPAEFPQHVSSLTPLFYWSFCQLGGGTQSRYQLQVGSDNDWSTIEQWDTGPVNAADTQVLYQGSPLDDRHAYFVRVRVGTASEWSGWSTLPFVTDISTSIRVPADRPSIQQALDAAGQGDTVLVAPGNYAEHITFGSVSVVLMSSGGDSVTFISGYISDQNLVSFPLGQHNSSTIRGFTIRNALGRPAVMIENSNSPQIIDCSMTNNSNGLYCYGDTVIIRGCTFAHNSGGMLIYVESAELTVIDQCSFYDNSWYGSFYGGGISHINYGVISFTKNLVYGNTASQGSIIQLRSDSFVNNTVYGNSTGSESAIVQVEGTEQRNNIIAFNRGGYGISSATPPEYNNVYGNTGGNYYGTVPGTGSISQDPLFTDTAQADFTLQSGSPCINAGDPDPQYNDPDGSRNDMGAVPRVSLTPYVLDLLIADEVPSRVISHSPRFEWNFFTDGSHVQDSFEVAVGTDENWPNAEMWSSGPNASTDTFVVYGGGQLIDGAKYYIRLRMNDGIRWSTWYYTTFSMNTAPTIPVLSSPSSHALVGNSPTLVAQNASDAQNDQLKYDFEVYSDSILSILEASASNIPAGSGSTNWVVNALLAENASHWWRARSFDACEHSVWSVLRPFWVDGTPEPPTAPVLTEPPKPDGKPVFSMLPTLKWSTSTDPDPFDTVRYKIEISLFPSFTYAFSRDSLMMSTITLTDSLSFGTHYYWRVTAKDKIGHSVMSAAPKDFWTWALGDINHSHLCDLSDLSSMVSYLTGGGYVISPKLVGDLNGNCFVDLTDLSTIVSYLTGGGAVFKVGCE